MSTVTANTDLVQRVLDCFPAGSYALPGLLRLVGIVESREVETAAVECKEEPRLLVNPDFAAEWAWSSEKLFMLVMHELHHILLGHTRLFKPSSELDNVVFDAVINAMLCHQLPDPAYTSFLTDFYDENEFPACLLRPPARWQPSDPIELPAALRQPGREELAAVYTQLYTEYSASYSDLYEALRKVLPPEAASDVKLLGDHSGAGAENQVLREHSDLLEEAVRQAAAGWPQPEGGGPGRSVQGLLALEAIQVRRRPSNRSLLAALIRRVAAQSDRHGGCPRWSDDVFSAVTAMIQPDRRATVLRALGQAPMLYRQPQTRQARRRVQQRVHVYVDVSGSVDSIRGALYGAVLDCREQVHPVVHLFSTKVADVSFREMGQGKCRTTGGTDIGCVIDHMVANRIRRAVIITDGFVGEPEGNRAVALRRVRLGVAFTPGYSTDVHLKGFFRASVTLQSPAAA